MTTKIKNRTRFQRALLQWYERHKRPLPWRIRHASPKVNAYRILVVEVMLQQTQVKTVIPYLERWMRRFPTIEKLARARQDHVLKLWEGLGYYSRARNLHRTAQLIVKNYAGFVPSDTETLLSLPGIGPYTAGAIASIAYNKPVPIIDGNVARVFARLFEIRSIIQKPEVQTQMYELAAYLLKEEKAGSFNQALMELGSLVCIPLTPRCPICPVSKWCQSFKKGNPSSLPVKTQTSVKNMDVAVGILEQEGKVLIRKRPEHGIWGGLWEFPSTVRKKGQSVQDALCEEFQLQYDFKPTVTEAIPPIDHRFTHRYAKIYPFVLKTNIPFEKMKQKNVKWVKFQKLENFSFPVPFLKLRHMIYMR